MPKSNNDVLGHYANYFKNWQVKLVGSKPTETMLDHIHKLGARPGKQALANAMSLRPEGVTGSQIVITCGAPQLNKMRGFVSDGLLKREATPKLGDHTVYKNTVTAKGLAKIKAFKADTAKVTAKPVAKAKVAKAKVAKVRKQKPATMTVPTPTPPVQAQATDGQAQS